MPHQVRAILRLQIILSAVVALVFGVIGGGHQALSAAVGGGIGVAASFAYAWRAIKTGMADPVQLRRAQMAGEAYKFAATMLLFALVFVEFKSVAPLPLFLGYVATFIAYWMALLER